MKSLELEGLFRNFDVPFCEVCNGAAIKVCIWSIVSGVFFCHLSLS